MTTTNFRPAAFAIFALGAGLATAPAFAQVRYVAPFDAGSVAVQPAFVEPVAAVEAGVVPPNVRGHFTCTFNEVHSRLERKNCAGNHYRY